MLKKSCVAFAMMSLMILGMAPAAHAQLSFEADWLYWSRNHDAEGNLVNGPEAIPTGVADYGYKPGYRFTLGGDFFSYRIDASFSAINTWVGSGQGTFGRAIVFDDTATAADNFLTPGSVLFDAATFTDMGLNDETLESERLMPGATWVATSGTNYKDWEINLGNSQYQAPWRLSGGFRRIQFDEMNNIRVAGTFDAIDTDDGAVFGDLTNDPNDQLSHTALASAGLSWIGGFANGFDAFDSPEGVDTLTYQTLGQTQNELSGAQIVYIGRVFDGEWITVEAIGKAGIYRNQIVASVQETVIGGGNDNSIYRRTFKDTETKAAFAGNLGLRGIVSLTDYINLVGGYEVLFMSGVALGADQSAGISKNVLGNTIFRAQTDGELIAHGGNLGLEILW